MKEMPENMLAVVEMKMLRWMCGVINIDKIWNESIGGTTKVVEIPKKIKERRLQSRDETRRRKQGEE